MYGFVEAVTIKLLADTYGERNQIYAIFSEFTRIL